MTLGEGVQSKEGKGGRGFYFDFSSYPVLNVEAKARPKVELLNDVHDEDQRGYRHK